MSVIGLAARAGIRWTVWARILILAEVAMLVKRHLERLDVEDRNDLTRLVRKSKGRPSNLSGRERRRLRDIVEKLDPAELAKGAAVAAVPWRRKP